MAEFSDNSLKPKSGYDIITPICMALLFAIGIIFIYSAQSYNIDEIPISRQFWIRQGAYVCIGAVVYMIIAKMDYSFFMEHAHIIYLICLALLVPLTLKECFGVPIPFVESRYNSTRWINLKVFSIQPSEIAKIGTCIMCAAMLSRAKMGSFKSSFKTLVKMAVVFFIPILLIFSQPDLGSTLVFPPMVFSMLYVSKLSKKFFAATFAAFALCVSVVALDIYSYSVFLSENNMEATEAARQNAYGSNTLFPLKDYQRNRILAFVAPDIVDPRGRDVSWNQRQSLISVGTGGLWGKGIAEGTQAKLGYLPSSVAYNDFIFSVIAEESGFAGGATVIALLGAVVVIGCLRAAAVARDSFGQYLCVGIAAMLMTHIFINVGMTIGIMPITGVPLPMLSYGGSFVLTCCILLGLVQSVYRHRQNFDV